MHAHGVLHGHIGTMQRIQNFHYTNLKKMEVRLGKIVLQGTLNTVRNTELYLD